MAYKDILIKDGFIVQYDKDLKQYRVSHNGEIVEFQSATVRKPTKIDLICQKLGYTRQQMQQFWDECKEINRNIKILSEAGKNWTDLTEYQISQLPTLKEVTLKAKAEKEEKERLEREAKEKKEQEEKYYAEHFEEIVLNKILNNETLTEKEYKSLVFEYEIEEVECGEAYKNMEPVSTIIELCGRNFEINWRRDTSDWGDHQFDDKPVEVRKVTKQTGYDLNMKPTYESYWEAL